MKDKDVRKWVLKALTSHAFEPIDPKSDDERAAGFVQLDDDRATAFPPGAVFEGGHALCSWRVEKIRIAASAIRAELSSWGQKFEAKNGRAPGRREKSEQKDLIRKALRAKTDPVVKVFDVSWELASGEVLVWASSRAIVEEVQAALEGALEVRLVPRVPSAFVSPEVLDAMTLTPELFGAEVA